MGNMLSQNLLIYFLVALLYFLYCPRTDAKVLEDIYKEGNCAPEYLFMSARE